MVMRAITAITLVLGLVFLAVGCDSKPPFSADDAIKLAKASAYQIPSPPSIYYRNINHIGDGGDIAIWPDESGPKNDAYASCPDVCHHPITFTTEVNLSNGGYDVTFKSEWEAATTDKKLMTHSWLFHISADRKAEFVREEGDTLPGRPEGG